MITLKKKPDASKCSDHRTISLIAHATTVVAGCLDERLKGKPRIYLEKVSLDLKEEKELGVQWRC
jgi:hypothetical protein